MIKYITIPFLAFFLTIPGYCQTDFLEDVITNTSKAPFHVKPVVMNFQDSISELNYDDYNGHMELGVAKLNSGDFREAIQLFTTSQKIYEEQVGDNYDRLFKTPYPYYYSGICYDALGNLDSSTYFFKLALKEMPFFKEAYNALGDAYLSHGKTDSALLWFKKGLKIDARDKNLNHNTAYCYFLMNKYHPAKKMLRANIEEHPHFLSSYFLLARIEEIRFKYTKAEEIYSQAIESNKEEIEPYYSRGFFYLKRNRLQNAKKDFLAVIDASPSDIKSSIILSLLEISEKQYVQGIDRMTNALNRQGKLSQIDLNGDQNYLILELQMLLAKSMEGPTTDEEKYLLGMLIEQKVFQKTDPYFKSKIEGYLNKFPNSEIANRLYLYNQVLRDEARTDDSLIDKIVTSYNAPAVHFMKAKKLYDLKSYPECIKEFRDITYQYPNFGLAYYYLGLSLHKIGENEKAIKSFDLAASLRPNDPYIYLNRGNCYEDLDNCDQAVKDYKNTLEFSELYGWPYNNIGICFENEGNYDSALYYYNKAVELNPNNSKAINNRGDIYYELDKLTNALADFSTSIKLDSDNPYYFTDRGDLYLYIDDYNKAIEDFTNAIYYKKDYSYAYKRLGDAYRYSERFKKAVPNYQKAIALDPEYKYAEYGLGWSFLQLEEYDSAVVHFTKATDLDSTYSYAFGNLGWTYYLLGRYDQCIKNSKIAVKYNENAFYAMFNIALATLCKGEFNEALELYKKYMKLAISKNKSTSGALTDLKNLIEKGVFVKESKTIIQEVFETS